MLQSHGYAQKFDIELVPYTGLDFSKLAFLFCGQGQMLPGIMREEVLNLPLFQPYFKELDRKASAAGLKNPSEFILKEKIDGDHELRFLSSLSLFALQVAMHDTLLFSGFRPTILSAHSFGEFAMLTAAGVLDFSSMVDFLILRQKALSQVEGQFSMLAVNGSKVGAFSTDIEYYPANYNSLLQTSYVCKSEDAEALRAIFKENRMASVRVDVDYPYHTPWLNSARENLSESLKSLKLQLKAPKTPFLSSVTGKIVDANHFSVESIQAAMVNQLTTPVHFPEQIRAIEDFGVAHFFEIAPVDVLSPFVEQILTSDKKPFKVDSFRRKIKVQGRKVEDRKRFKNSKVLEVFNKALKSLSGYTVDDIQLEDRIREDLGIDSIKKADIVFQMIENMSGADAGAAAPVNLADLATFGDVLDFLENSLRAREKMTASSIEKQPVFSLVRRQWIPKERVDLSSEAAPELHIVDSADLNKSQFKWGDDEKILVLHWRELEDELNLRELAKKWLRFFRSHPISAERFVFVHQETPLSLLLNAFFITWTQELNIAYKSIRQPTGQPLKSDDIFLEVLDFYHTDVKVTESGERLVRQFLPEKAEAFVDKKLNFQRVLIFGGFGGVGQHCLKALEKCGVKTLRIVGRTPLNEKIRASLAQLEGLAEEIEYFNIDVRQVDAILGVLNETKFPKWDLVIHSVGVEVSERLKETTDENIDQIVDGKFVLAEVLREYAKKSPETKIVFNSSVIPEFGNIGQTTYGLVNQFLNQSAESSSNILSLQWPAWKQTGMANYELITRSLSLQGLPVLEPAVGTKLFGEALNLKSGSYLVICPDFMDDYLSSGPLRQNFKNLFKIASKNRQLYALTGLTQKNLPYLTHHIVKKLCPFPASGSLSLMLFRAYQERGKIGRVRNFSAINFLIVQPETSNYLFEASFPSWDEMYMQVRSTHPVADGYVDLQDSPKRETKTFHFKSDREMFFEFDQNVAVAIGEKFRLEQGIFEDSQTGRMIVRMDLAKTPFYTGIPILDKFHKLFEVSFNASCLKNLRLHHQMIVPKSIEQVEIFPENFLGSLYYVVVDDLVPTDEGPVGDVWVVNAKGEAVVHIHRLRSIVVGREDDEIAKDIEIRPLVKEFF